MAFEFTSDQPLYLQVANQLEEAILADFYPDGSQLISTTEFARTFHINPATVLKGMNRLVEAGLVEKKRGLGMFVVPGAKQKLQADRQDHFFENYVVDLCKEAHRLGLSEDALAKLITKGMREQYDRNPT